jgi:hypothetical protein
MKFHEKPWKSMEKCRDLIKPYKTNYNYLALSENGVCPQVSILYWEKTKWILYWYPIFKQAQVKATH